MTSVHQGRPTANRSYRHEALLWHDTEEFLAATVPFIEQGLAAEEAVAVAVTGDRMHWLREAIGTDAKQVLFIDMAGVGRNPSRIIPALQQLLDEQSLVGKSFRAVGEPVWVGQRAEEVAESQLHEALLSVAVDPDTPCWLMCPYDAKQLSPAVIEEVYRSHPAVLDGTAYRGSHLYGGRAHVDQVFGTELQRLSGRSTQLAFGTDDLHRVSAFVASTAHAAGIGVDRAAGLAVAVQELAANSLHRGSTTGSVTMVTNDEAVVCDVFDETRLDDPLTGRRAAPKGRGGIWSAHDLCDLVQVRSTARGTTVRVHLWR